MNDAVDRILLEREALDRGLPGSMMLSLVAHLVLLGFAFVAPFFFREPALRVQHGFVVALPAGGGGPRLSEPPADAAPQTAPEPAPQVEPPPKVIKPPKEEPRKGLPELNAKRSKRKLEKEPGRHAGVSGSRGTSSQTPGLEFGPPGPGVPGGTDLSGDWYLAGVQQSIWRIWITQIRPDMAQPVVVSFTIHADGAVSDIVVVESSGVFLVDNAAKRAIASAAPFAPLPRHYETNRYTIQALFKRTH